VAQSGVNVKAAVFRRYGSPSDVVRIEEVDDPVPGDGEVLIAVRAASVNPMDAHLMRGKPALARLAFGWRRPKRTRPGVDVAGLVEAVGPGVTRFRPGDAVFGSCRGAIAERACATESWLALKPANISVTQAAAAPVAGVTALQGLRDKARLRAGQSILINGAAGGVGTFAVQIAKAFGAEVTAVCSARNLDLVRTIGADRAVDYGKEDFTRGEARYDLIFDLVSTHGFSAMRRVLAPGGMVLAAGGPGVGGLGVGRWAARLIGGLLAARFTSAKLVLLMAKLRGEDLAVLAEMMETGQVTPVVERCYSLREAAAAIEEVAQGHARGKVVVVVGGER
jgi:NADPH:quinone reductase-like Zn-dependent oxidoreductase